MEKQIANHSYKIYISHKKVLKKSSSQKKKFLKKAFLRAYSAAAVSENKSDEHCYFSELKSVGRCVSFF